ncbi:hypothetical protein Tamer19_07020 [Cupriavidus sp. TA19]|nr:hypothetical protein Tamer19_07020 [Cupriavidus sp. TA19]
MPHLAIMKEYIVLNTSARTNYRFIHATSLLRDRQVGQSPKRNIQRFRFIRLPATRWHRAITLLIDLDRAVNDGWPNLRSPSCPRAKGLWSVGRSHQAIIRRLAGSNGERHKHD